MAVRSNGEGNGVAEDSWNTHIGYLEDEVKKIDDRADKLEATIPDLENEQKKHALRELPQVSRARETEIPVQCEGCRRRPCESGESLPQVSMLLGWRAESTETQRLMLNLPRMGAMQEC